MSSSISTFSWVTGVLLFLVNTTTGDEAQAEFVKKWRRHGAITVTAVDYDGRELINYTETLSADRVTEIEQCFKRSYTDKILPREHYIDLDKLLQAYGNCLFKVAFSKDHEPSYEAITGRQAEILMRKYRKFDLKSTLGDVRYFPIENRPPQPKTVMTKWIHNHGEKNAETTISESIVTEDSVANTMTHTVGATVTATAEFSFIASIKTSMTAGASHTWTDVTTTTTTKTLTIADTVTVPAKGSAEIIWLLTEQEFKMRWEAPMYISGGISIKARKNNVNRMYFLPVEDMAKFFNEIHLADDSRVFIVLKGYIEGKKNIGSHLQVKEYIPAISEAFGPCTI